MGEDGMSALYVFRNDVIDWVIALDSADATKVWEEHSGDDYDSDAHAEWLRLPDEDVLAINYGDDDDDDEHVEKTCAELVAIHGRCFLASTEY